MSMGEPAKNRTPDRDHAPALGGRLSAVSLFDLCQFLMLNRKTGNLTVRSGSSSAYLIFLDGQLISAADDSRRDGEGVVLRAVQWPEGTFEFVPGPVPPDRRIQSSTENILLEAARRIDEMHAGDEHAGEDARGAEAAFLEKQKRGASLVDAFRSAVADAELMRTGAGWKGAVLSKLRLPSGERLLLGPGSRVGIVVGGRCEDVPGIPAHEVRSWMDDLAPPPQAGEGRSGFCLPHPARQADGSILWAVRVLSPGGDWVAASPVHSSFPKWSDLGLPETDFSELERLRSGLVLVLGESTRGNAAPPMRDGLAAWLNRRAEHRMECAIVVEDLPRFEWSTLPGAWRGIPVAWAQRAGRLETLLRTSGARTLIWIGGCRGRILAETLQLASAGFLVVLAEEARDLDDWLGRAERRLALENLSWRFPEEDLGIAWRLRSGPEPSGLPLQSQIIRLERGGRPD
jgi:hypothetical protein